MRTILLAAVALLSAGAAAAAETDSPPPQRPLTLEAVLESSRRHAPQILEAGARVRVAEGRALTAEGAFDTTLTVESKGRLGGAYDGRYVETSLTRPLEGWGGSLYGGYSLSDGRFAPYEQALQAGGLGDVKAGAIFSLLRDRAIDERRFARANARLDVEVAELERVLAAVAVQRRAVAAYNAWVGAGLRLKVYENLLALARDRQKGVARQVELGARASIVLTEIEQAALRREALVARARQDLTNAAVNLSFFLRDAEARPLKPTPDRLPGGFVPLRFDPQTARVTEGRPDLRLIDVRIDQALGRLELDRNAQLPRLDLRVEASQSLTGGLPQAFFPRNAEVTVGLRFSLPLQQRAANGRVLSASGEIAAASRRRQALEDQIDIDLQRLANDLRASAEIQKLAEAESERAATMASAERRRFEFGASDVFLVNLREEAAADAEVRRLDAAARQIDARAELAAAAMDLQALGLSGLGV